MDIETTPPISKQLFSIASEIRLSGTLVHMSASTSQPRPARRGRPRVINNRSDVRAAAAALFAEHGYRATGVRDIADALGIGATSIYSHIKTKAELLHEIVIDTLDALLAVQHDAIASTTDVVEQLRRAAESQMRFLGEHPQEALIAIREFRWAEGDALTLSRSVDVGIAGRLRICSPRETGREVCQSPTSRSRPTRSLRWPRASRGGSVPQAKFR